MNIGGIQKTSVLDYPDKLCAIIWTSGCNLRCPFCYNKDLVFNKLDLLDNTDVLNFLRKRKGKLEALSISGGEPLIQDDIFDFISKVKKMNYLIKIDTNGTFPKKLKILINENLVDYIAMDIKAPKDKYNKLSGRNININKIEESVEIIKNYAPYYEFKTTVIPKMLDKNDILKIAKWLEGSKMYYLQQFNNDSPMISSNLKSFKPYSQEYLYEIINEIKSFFEKCELRGI